MGGAHAAVYEGKTHRHDIPIPIIKINRSYTELPSRLEKNPKDTRMRGPVEIATDPDDRNKIIDTRGLRKEHVGRHLNAIADGAAEIAATRHQQTDNPMQTLREADFRGLKRHIRWMIRDWARLNARQIIDLAEQHRCDLIVFESLRGSRRPDYDKLGDNAERQKAERILYAYGQVRRKVTEKAVERGMRTVTAPYHKSSKVCSRCGREQENDGLWRKNKTTRKLFVCEHCQAKINSDANAARVLARVFLGEIMLPAPPPGGTA
jgi:DNA-directed RNA polymerase subunit RPC12/RpoP